MSNALPIKKCLQKTTQVEDAKISNEKCDLFKQHQGWFFFPTLTGAMHKPLGLHACKLGLKLWVKQANCLSQLTCFDLSATTAVSKLVYMYTYISYTCTICIAAFHLLLNKPRHMIGYSWFCSPFCCCVLLVVPQLTAELLAIRYLEWCVYSTAHSDWSDCDTGGRDKNQNDNNWLLCNIQAGPEPKNYTHGKRWSALRSASILSIFFFICVKIHTDMYTRTTGLVS